MLFADKCDIGSPFQHEPLFLKHNGSATPKSRSTFIPLSCFPIYITCTLAAIMLQSLFLLVVLCTVQCLSLDSVVSLSDGKYRGIPQSNGITRWLGMRYAAAPLGPFRFAAPQDSPAHDGIKGANQVGYWHQISTHAVFLTSSCSSALGALVLVRVLLVQAGQKIAYLSTCTRLQQHPTPLMCLSMCSFQEAASMETLYRTMPAA